MPMSAERPFGHVTVAYVSMLLGNHVADCDADESLHTQARAES